MGTTIIAVQNSKGGVAKTTSSVNIAARLSLMGKRTLLCDLDAQASATLSLGYNPLDFATTIVNVFEDASKVAEAIYDTDIEGLSLMPSHPLLSSTELSLISMHNREKRLAKGLKLIDGVFDFIILDCPPQLSLVTVNALACSNFLLVPCETSQLAYYALEQLMDTVAGVKEDLNENIEVLGVIATLYDCRSLLDRDTLASMQNNYETLGVVKRLASAKRGLGKGLPVVITEPKSQVAISYRNITDKIIEKVEGR